MSFGRIQGQARAVETVRRMLAHGRLPSAFLFVGAHHVGKRLTALELAKAVNCARPAETDAGPDAETDAGPDACDGCASCRRIDAAVHPDVEVVEPDGQFIRIGQVRQVADRLGLIPRDARKRVVAVAEAERMNPEAANAFLKTLEEPPADTLIVLCAERAGRLPETIVSRCVPVRFGLLDVEAVRAAYAADGKLSAEELDFAVRFAQGRLRPDLPQKAQEWALLRDEVLTALDRPTHAAFAEVSERIAKWAGSADWPFVLEWLETWFHDLALLGSGADPARLVNGDRADALRRWLPRLPPEQADAAFNRVLATRDALWHNANKALALEALWLDVKQLAHEGQGGAHA